MALNRQAQRSGTTAARNAANEAAARDAAQRAKRAARGAFRQETTRRLGPNEIQLIAPEIRQVVNFTLNDGYSSPEGAAGGWEDVARHGQVAATVFTGAGSPRRLPLRLILGRWPVPRGVNIADEIATLERIAYQPVDARRGKRPPLVKVRGDVRHEGARWFVDNDGVQWDDENFVRNEQGKPVRAFVTVTLRRFVSVRLLRPDEPGRRDGRRDPLRIRVKRGQDAWGIARDVLGTRGSREARAVIREFRWADGPKAGQRIRDPRRIRAGDWIKVPAFEAEMVGGVRYR